MFARDDNRLHLRSTIETIEIIFAETVWKRRLRHFLSSFE